MKPETETAIRRLLAEDGTVRKEGIERALSILYGKPIFEEDMIHVVRRKDAVKILKVNPSTLDYYVRCGYLRRVFGGGRRKALGISRDSLLEFMRTGEEGPRTTELKYAPSWSKVNEKRKARHGQSA